MTELTDRVALVTGASRGTGAAIAVRLAETAERLGFADVLVANAGTGPRANLADVDLPAWDDAMNINLRASFFPA